MEIVGGSRELAWLGGRRGCVEIAGEPGVGKTRLLAELCARAGGRRVLCGRATEFEADVPYGIFAEAFDDHPLLRGGEVAQLHREARTLLTRLAPALVVLDDVHWADRASLELIAH